VSAGRDVVLTVVAALVWASACAVGVEDAGDAEPGRRMAQPVLQDGPPEAVLTVAEVGVGVDRAEGPLVDLDVGAGAFAVSAVPGRVIVFGVDGVARLTVASASAGPVAIAADGSEVYTALGAGVVRRVSVPSGTVRGEWALEGAPAIVDLAVDHGTLYLLTENGEVLRTDLAGAPLAPLSPTWQGARGLVRSTDGLRVLTGGELVDVAGVAPPIPLPEELADAAFDACYGRLYGLTPTGDAWIAVDVGSGEVVHREPWDGATRGIGVLSATPGSIVVAHGASETGGASVFRFEPEALAFVDAPELFVHVGESWLWRPGTTHDPSRCGPLTWTLVEGATWLTLDPSTGALSLEATCDSLGVHPVILQVSDGAAEVSLEFVLEVIDADADGDHVTDCGDSCAEQPNTGSDLDRDGIDDVCDTDLDGDGLDNDAELAIPTDPRDADSDADGLLDSEERNPGADPDGDGLINALDPDSDNDTLSDAREVELGTDPERRDTDQDAFLDAEEVMWGTDPLSASSPGSRYTGPSSKPVDEAEEGCAVAQGPGASRRGAGLVLALAAACLWGMLRAR